MLNGKSSNLNQKVPTYIPLADAVQKYGISEEALTQLIETGKIEAVQLPSGELLVAADNGSLPKTKEQIIQEKYTHLRQQPITVTDAADKYDLHRDTVLEWVKKDYITSLKQGGRGSRMELDEAEVAYCAKIYHERGGKRGVRLFDENGNPYQLKHPQLARYRRKQRQQLEKVN